MTYAYRVDYAGLSQIGSRPVSDRTFAGQYLAPVLRYSPSPTFFDVGLFAACLWAIPSGFIRCKPIVSPNMK